MDSDDLRRWFGAYLEVFEACGRGAEDGIGRLLDCYDVPFVLGTDDGVLALTSEADVTRALQLQMRPVTTAAKSRLRRRGPDTVSALYRALLSRECGDGTEMGRLRVTYLITDGPAGRRISALLVHSARR